MCVKHMQRLCEGTRQTYDALRHLSGMSGIRQNLDRCMDEMLEESVILKRMGECLTGTMQIYAAGEIRAAEYAEEAKVFAAGISMEQWDIPEWVFQILGQEESDGGHIY